MRTFTGPSVLVVDELGYLPMDADSAHWIFQVVSRRYERGSIVLTSNRGFADWGTVFADQGSRTLTVSQNASQAARSAAKVTYAGRRLATVGRRPDSCRLDRTPLGSPRRPRPSSS